MTDDFLLTVLEMSTLPVFEEEGDGRGPSTGQEREDESSADESNESVNVSNENADERERDAEEPVVNFVPDESDIDEQANVEAEESDDEATQRIVNGANRMRRNCRQRALEYEVRKIFNDGYLLFNANELIL